MKKLLIDTTKQPKIPDGWTIESHNTSLGKIDPTKIELYWDDEQKNGKHIEGNKLLEKLKDKPVLNATVFDWLLENPKYIPEDWKGKYVYFWGTIFRGPGGCRYTLFLYFSSVGSWFWDCFWLDDGRGVFGPSAVLVSISSKKSKSLTPISK